MNDLFMDIASVRYTRPACGSVVSLALVYQTRNQEFLIQVSAMPQTKGGVVQYAKFEKEFAPYAHYGHVIFNIICE